MAEYTIPSDSYAQQRPVALATGTAASVFTLVFLGLLIHNGYQHYVVGTARENQLAEQKRQLLQDPENTSLVTQIRQEDLTLRRNKLRQLHTSQQAGLMALIGALIAFGTFKWAGDMQGIRPQPVPSRGDPPQIRQRGLARLALVGLAFLLVAGVVYFAWQRPAGFVVAGSSTDKPPAAGADYGLPADLQKNWHRFRGFAGAGVTSLQDIPTQWNGTAGEGILWKTPLGLPGNNSPILWEDKLFLSGATDEKREVYCYDAGDGKLLWTGDVPTTGTEELDVMEDTGMAANTLATDGKRVYAIFATGDIAAFDFTGQRLWHQNLGTPESAYGYATSLEVWQDRVIVQYDQAYAEDGKSRMIALIGSSGKVAWETKRPVGNGWTSPIVAPVGQTYQLLTVGAPWVIAYDPNTGKEIWRAEVVDGDVAPSPIMAGDLLIAVEPYAHSVALRVTGTGNVTETHEVWRNEDAGPDIATPVCDAERIYLMDTMGMIYTIDADSGELVWEYDFEETVQASPSLVNGKLYILAENGVMFIGTPGAEAFTLETQCELGEGCLASPAFMPGRIFIRGKEHLYCIGK